MICRLDTAAAADLSDRRIQHHPPYLNAEESVTGKTVPSGDAFLYFSIFFSACLSYALAAADCVIPSSLRLIMSYASAIFSIWSPIRS